MKIKSAFFAGGSFWNLQEAFDAIDGVCFSIVGYMGGTTTYPDYNEVMNEHTGHVQALKVIYNQGIISYPELVNHFFLLHNPTSFNRQGPDYGEQFRSIIFYQTEEERKTAERLRSHYEKQNIYNAHILTQITKADTFYPAEEHHQKFFEKHASYFGLN